MTIDVHNLISGEPINNGGSYVGYPRQAYNERAFTKPEIGDIDDKYQKLAKYPRFYTGDGDN